MHADINAFPSSYFYNGAVRTDASVTSRASGVMMHPHHRKRVASLLFWAAEISQGEQLSQVKTAESSAKSRFNQAEAGRVAELAKSLALHAGSAQVAVLSW